MISKINLANIFKS